MRFRLTLTWLLLAAGLLSPMRTGAVALFPRKGKLPPDLSEILSRMNEAAKRLKTLSANLEYTKVTVLVNDKSREEGRLFFRKGKTPDIRIEMQQPESKVILFKKNKAEIPAEDQSAPGIQPRAKVGTGGGVLAPRLRVGNRRIEKVL